MTIYILIVFNLTYSQWEGAELHQTLGLILVILLLDLDISHLELLLLAQLAEHPNVVAVLAHSCKPKQIIMLTEIIDIKPTFCFQARHVQLGQAAPRG